MTRSLCCWQPQGGRAPSLFLMPCGRPCPFFAASCEIEPPPTDDITVRSSSSSATHTHRMSGADLVCDPVRSDEGFPCVSDLLGVDWIVQRARTYSALCIDQSQA
jgi:hypothetical protein